MDLNAKILAALVEKGIITKETSEEVSLSSVNSGKSVEQILTQKHLAQTDEILAAKAKSLHIPFISLAGKGISPEILNLIPEQVARKYKIIPFELDETTGKLSVAMADPRDLPLLEFLEQKSGKSISAHLGVETEILERIIEEYSKGLAAEVSEALIETGGMAVKTIEASQIGQIIKEAPIAKIVSVILEYALKSRASDIHVEPHDISTRVRYRIDGILHEKLALPKSVYDAVVSRIKILSGMKIDERRSPQDGRFNFKMGEEEVDFRVSTLPLVHGEKVMLRLLKKTGGIPDLPALGLIGPTLKNLEKAITAPHGMILSTGPTGSGKTTTLYSILSRLNSKKVNIITLEDPVEYEITGINQAQINPQAGLTFASGLRSILRQDPNIILVGEIRDSETTSLAVQAALTGHLVFSTLHTNNAATSIPRLIDLGAEPFLIVSVLNALMAQRIVRRICVTCKEVYTPIPEVAADIKKILGPLLPTNLSGNGKQLTLYRGVGCKECSSTGYLGRIGIYETIMMSSNIARMVLERATAEVIENKAMEEGMITLMQDGYLKVLDGITTIEEVLRVAHQ